ncbi:uncharacterized protein LOC114755015 [Neltuma alba]|uniref:uncharacterized protein LOC114755015 n=1 Tax=Neltuma alba TaxID=207710 RepID=UPI0010A43AA3|nr:uncharacterized protein LOC114755015 [Prosopis alba]
MELAMSLGDVLLKVGLFFLVQALVYLILTSSSNIFSKSGGRSQSFRTARSLSIRRILAVLSDQPAEPSPSAKGPPSPAAQNYKSE